jgi:hypothetical protein
MHMAANTIMNKLILYPSALQNGNGSSATKFRTLKGVKKAQKSTCSKSACAPNAVSAG